MWCKIVILENVDMTPTVEISSYEQCPAGYC